MRGQYVPYFVEITIKVLNEYLNKYKFRLLESTKTEIIYQKKDIFISISYYPEDVPKYYLMIGIGFIQREKKLNRYKEVGLWYALSKEGIDYDYQVWGFRTKEELEKTLTFIRSEFIEKFAKKLWENPNRLWYLIKSQQRDIELENKEQAKMQRMQQAKQAFEYGQYEKAMKIYEEIGINNLSVAELRIYKMCKKAFDA